MADESPVAVIEATREHRRGLYATVGMTLLITCLLGAALFAPSRNRLASPHLGAELHGPGGDPIPLDEPLDSRP